MTSRERKRKLEADLDYAHSQLDAALATVAIIRAWLNEPTEITHFGIRRTGEYAALLIQHVNSALGNAKSFERRLGELKAEVVPPFYVPGNRPDVADALRAAGIDVEVV